MCASCRRWNHLRNISPLMRPEVLHNGHLRADDVLAIAEATPVKEVSGGRGIFVELVRVQLQRVDASRRRGATLLLLFDSRS